jgi:hypothetical protein
LSSAVLARIVTETATMSVTIATIAKAATKSASTCGMTAVAARGTENMVLLLLLVTRLLLLLVLLLLLLVVVALRALVRGLAFATWASFSPAASAAAAVAALASLASLALSLSESLGVAVVVTV